MWPMAFAAKNLEEEKKDRNELPPVPWTAAKGDRVEKKKGVGNLK